MEKKQYNIERKNQATTKIMLRGLVCGYLIYLGWQLAFEGGDDPTFPLAARMIAGVFFAAAGVVFFAYSWKRYRADCRAAEVHEEEFLEELPEETGEDAED